MKLVIKSPKNAINTLSRQKSLRSEIDVFKLNLIALLDKISIIENRPKDESEEHLKNDLRDFLRDTYYRDSHAINTKDKKDLVIHLDKTTNSEVGVIIEAKRPNNISEMITAESPNKKALHELILYYVDERNKVGNFQLKQLIITNINEWFIIDVNYFDKYIYDNAQIKKLYQTKTNDSKNNPFFYQEIEKIVAKIDAEIPCIYFDIRNYNTILRSDNNEQDGELVALYKIFSPQYLLKIVPPNDSNSLNEQFYKELLHIIGLEEAKENGKNIIRRKKENRHSASFIESTIEELATNDSVRHLTDQSVYGKNREDITFNVALELCITWVNRILFLKLLEGQLLTYHKGDKDYNFLNAEMIPDFSELFKLFHKVLAIGLQDRNESIKTKYSRVPYLNSSLFEISELEDQTIKVNSLDSNAQLELLGTTILKDIKKDKYSLPTLKYLFQFLDAYDFASEGAEKVQEDSRAIITASVLGKVFEKINGYKDGSVFTPAFITMYMCRQSIRLAVVDKFNSVKQWNIKHFDDIYNKIQDKKEANNIVNSLKICDPAVGSGHFLVSALNEIIAIKSELGILIDEKGKMLRDYKIEIINDELVIIDDDENIVVYNPKNTESNRIQKTLFQEKQSIIENCLFGVDINPNSVKICRLRLWIELLKNAYYKAETDYTELETLPNIDINIKCGNSLLSRFALNEDLAKALKSIKYDINAYKGFVRDYKNEKNRETKKGITYIINSIKSDFKIEIYKNDPKVIKLGKLGAELYNWVNQTKMFDEDAKQKKIREKQQQKLEEEINGLSIEIEQIKTNAIYKNAFEWRFEFPEILSEDGTFEGFDLIIGNPPYIKEDANKNAFNGLRNLESYQGKADIWYLFGDLGLKLLKKEALLCYIATNNWVTNAGASKLRNIIINNSQIINLTDFGAFMVFENASIQTMVMLFKNTKEVDNYTFEYKKLEGEKRTIKEVLAFLDNVEDKYNKYLQPNIIKEHFNSKTLTFNSDEDNELLNKIKAKHNFHLIEKTDKELNINAEFGNGIDVMQDFVNNVSAEKMKEKAKVGDGVFVLSQQEYDKKEFSIKEKEIIKPYFTTKQLGKYYGNSNNTHWIIYTKSNINKPDKKTKKIPLDNYPTIKKHLDTFSSIITSAFAPYGLNRTREQYLFEGTKILAQRKCPKEPIFTYTEFDCFVSRAFVIIKSDRINLKYLTGLLNSKLVAFWLRRKGKMQGNNYQLDKEPLLEIPILKPTDSATNKIAALVEQIITQKQEGKDTLTLEKEIDKLVYNLYDLTENEIKIIEG